MTMFYVKVTDEMKIAEGGGNPEENEQIEVAEIPATQCLELAMDEQIEKPVGFVFAMHWFYMNKLKGT